MYCNRPISETIRTARLLQSLRFGRLLRGMKRQGFTLVELLVVIAIIGTLVALLLPAVQAAREAARMAQCKNNLRQIALAMLHYESTHRAFPAGGWSSSWTGDPNIRTGPRQPGGWIYQSLPYLEQQSIADIGLGLSKGDLIAALTEQGKSVVSVFNCPSRRSAKLYPTVELTTWNYFPSPLAAKTDYAANGGSAFSFSGSSGPRIGSNFFYSDCRGVYPNCDWINDQTWMDQNWNGIVGDHAGARLSDITDGAASTFLTGEKWLYEIYYETVSVDAAADNAHNRIARDNPGDNGSMYVGFDYDTIRVCGTRGNGNRYIPKRDTEFDLNNPQRDKKGAHYRDQFGGPHQAGVVFAKCDGSVNSWSFEIDPSVWVSLGARNDGGL